MRQAMAVIWIAFGFLLALALASLGCGLFSGGVKIGASTASAAETHQAVTAPQFANDWRIDLFGIDPGKPLLTLTGHQEPKSPGTTDTTRREAAAASAPVEVPKGADPGTYKQPPPTAEIPPIGGTVRAVGSGIELVIKEAERLLSAFSILYVIGALGVIAGGLFIGVFKQFGIGAWTAGSGAGLLILAYGIQRYPWLVFVLVGLIVLAAVLYILFVRKTVQQSAALDAHVTTNTTLVKAIEAVPKPVGDFMKEKIQDVATADKVLDVVKPTITAIKLNGAS